MRALLLLLLSGSGGAPMAASLDALSSDGHFTWRVAATDDAPPWCCFGRASGSPAACACDLDSRNVSYNRSDDFQGTTGEAQIYAVIVSGKAQRIRVLSPQCPVTSQRAIIDLGAVEVDESLGWLRTHVTSSTPVSHDALAAIAVHKGSAPLRFLIDMAEAGLTTELRKDAIFWMSQVRIAESASVLERLMFQDESAELRQHAAFALSQSSAKIRDDALIRQGRKDTDPEVRSQAWFWLAQTGTTGSEEAIRWAISNDPDEGVREQAVFALSELPGERAVDALLSVLGDRKMQHGVREQALFWLAQSDSDRAFAHVDRLLTGSQAEPDHPAQ